MTKFIFMILITVSLLACAETWEGVKKDSKEVTRSVGDAGNAAVDKIKEAFSDEKDKEEK